MRNKEFEGGALTEENRKKSTFDICVIPENPSTLAQETAVSSLQFTLFLKTKFNG
jgi:hypothetical protein